MKPVAHIAFALFLAALQAALLRWLGGGGWPVLLVAACLVHVSLHGGNVDGSISAFGIGYVLDVTAGTPKGLMTFLAVVLFLVLRATSAAVDVRGRAPFALLSGVTALLLSLGSMLLLRNATAIEGAPGAALLGRMLLEALLTAAASPAVLVVLRRLDALFQREEPGLLR